MMNSNLTIKTKMRKLQLNSLKFTVLQTSKLINAPLNLFLSLLPFQVAVFTDNCYNWAAVSAVNDADIGSHT